MLTTHSFRPKSLAEEALRRIDRGGDVEHRHRMTLERLREHLAGADSELEAAQHFLDPNLHDEDEMAFVRAIANARTLVVGDALETERWRLEETGRD